MDKFITKLTRHKELITFLSLLNGVIAIMLHSWLNFIVFIGLLFLRIVFVKTTEDWKKSSENSWLIS